MPLAMVNARKAAKVVPVSMHRAPFWAPKSKPLARLRGCVGKRGMHSKNATARINPAGPYGPNDSIVWIINSKKPSGTASPA